MTFDLATGLDALKVAIGLVYLYLEYHARPQMWWAAVIMPAIGVWLFFTKGLYADCGINLYYLAIAVYGCYAWRHGGGKDKKEQLPIGRIGPRRGAWLVLAWLAVWGAVYGLLVAATDSTVPVLDSLTASLSIVGMWMLARKLAEQWLVWFVVDGIYAYLYLAKGLYFSAGLYVFYTAAAIAGLRKWLKLARQRR